MHSNLYVFFSFYFILGYFNNIFVIFKIQTNSLKLRSINNLHYIRNTFFRTNISHHY